MKTTLVGALLLFAHLHSFAQFDQGKKLLSFATFGDWSKEKTKDQFANPTEYTYRRFYQQSNLNLGLFNDKDLSRGLFLTYRIEWYDYRGGGSVQKTTRQTGGIGYFQTKFKKIGTHFFGSYGYNISYRLGHYSYQYESSNSQNNDSDKSTYTHGLGASLQLGIGYFVKPNIAVHAGHAPLYATFEYEKGDYNESYNLIHSILAPNFYAGVLFIL